MKNPVNTGGLRDFVGVCCAPSGERGIRTPGGVTLNSFQDCRIRPLCHFSFAGANIETFFEFRKIKIYFFYGFIITSCKSIK